MQSNSDVTAGFTEARRELLQKYLRGRMPPRSTGAATIAKRSDSGPAPLSYSQQQIWLHAQLAGAYQIYNEPITIRRYGELNVSALERSFVEIVRRHEAWRTTFEWAGGAGVQIVHPPPAEIKFPFVDLRGHPQPGKEALRLATEDARQRFDLVRGPMYRVRLVRLSEAEHRLFITLHHVIFDGVSLYRVLVPELLTAYEAFAKNDAPVLSSSPIQYPDYAVWQRESVKEISPEQFSYWRTILSDAPILELKTDRPRPTTQTYAGAMELFQISPATTAALKNLTQERGTTLFMTMTAAFMALLRHYTDQEDIVIGAITSGRNREEVRNLLGCFLNTVPIRCAFSKEVPFTDVLTRVRDATLGALSHDEVPFELLVQKFAQKRDPSRAPLVQALIVVEPPLEPLPPGWAFTHMDVDTGTAKFDLQLGLDDRAEGFSGRFIYNSDLFERQTIRRLKSDWLNLLERVAKDPTRPVGDLVKAIVTERALPPMEWSGVRTNYPRDSAIHEIFEQQVKRTPDATALIFQNTRLSYDALNRRANQLAWRLQKFGVARDVPVGVWMERSPEMLIALLGILKASGAYVPLDPSYPTERLALMINDTQMPVILTQKHLPQLTAARAQTLYCNEESFADEDDTNLDHVVRATDLAYVMYTSGSTGTPKGVAVPHRAILRLVKNTNYADFSPNETFLQLAPISFDASTFEIWGPLLNGGKLAIMPAMLPTLEEIGRAIKDYSVTTLWLTAGLFNVMVDERLDDLKSLHQLLAGGDVLPVPHVRKALHALPQTQLINGYGPTEGTTFACCHKITVDSLGNNSIPIGKPIANTTAHILDANLKRVPVGAIGQLWIGGDGLARGYWNEKKLTAEKFVADPFSREPGARLYKTGDLARWRFDGTIEFIGRVDHQIKLRGFRIELGEIEAALKQQPGVRDSVVVAREDVPNQKHLVAYVVGSASQDELLAALKKSLPDYMVPSAIVSLASLPCTSSGKTDRDALPRPQALNAQAADGFIAPRTALEEKLAAIWREVLGVNRVGVFDNFFDLGGHSLAGLRVVNQLSGMFGQTLSPSIFFQAPTIAAMAQLLQETDTIAPATAVSSQPEQEKTGEYVQPYLGLQLELIDIWKDLLGLRVIGIRDNFFKIGGAAQSAEEMLQRVAAAFGKTISIAEFSTNSTIENLAAELARRAIEESPSLFAVNESGARPAFFYLHGDLFGGGFYTLKLSRALGLDQPFYVMPPHDVRWSSQAPTVEQMARAHLQDLRAVRPHGPYIIGGFCLGGIVAYELAQQLASLGESVEMLLLIDAEPEDKTLRVLRRAAELCGRWLGWNEATRVNRFRHWWLRRVQFALWQKESAQARSRLVFRQLRKRITSVWNCLRQTAGARADVAGPGAERDVPATFLYAAAGYRPRPYHGRMATLFSEDLLHRGDHLEQAWLRFAPRVTVHSLRGRHLECITAHIETLAETIDRCLTSVASSRRQDSLGHQEQAGAK
jgi:amino acid adenylation domain-containing protein